MQFTQITPSVPSLEVVNGHPTTLSTHVAEFFGKLHKDVLKAVRNLTESVPELNGRNFAPVEIKDAKGQMRPAYRMDRKGFVLLAMGFTGEKALQFKIAYIDAFDRMEEELRNSTAAKLKAVIPLTPRQQYKIQRAVAERAKGSHVHFNTIYKAIKIYFKVAKYDQIPASRFDECINFIQTVDLRIPEVLSDQPVEFPKPQLPSCPHCELITRGNLHLASVKEIQQLTIDARNALAAIEKERIRAWTCLHEIVFKLKAFV